MTGSRLWIKNFQKIIAIALMIAWIFIGVPRIWNFPPQIQEAQAAVALRGTTKIGSAGNGGDVTLTFDTGGNAPQTGDVVILFGGRGNAGGDGNERSDLDDEMLGSSVLRLLDARALPREDRDSRRERQSAGMRIMPWARQPACRGRRWQGGGRHHQSAQRSQHLF